MIKIHGPIKNIKYVACSGGIDSMALLSFIHRVNKDIIAAFFDHGTETSKEAHAFVISYCLDRGIRFETETNLEPSKPKEDSWEEHWRKQRYKFLHSLDGDVATAHHLDDAAETYLFGCIHGRPKYIWYRLKNVVRPLLLSPKSELISWCDRHGIPHVEDVTNLDTRFVRNRIRHNIIPEVQQVNPGFLTVVRKLVKERLDEHS